MNQHHSAHMPELNIMPLPHHAGLPMPAYQTASAAGMDLAAAIDADIMLEPAQRLAIATGLAMAIPDGYEGQIRPRSGLAAKHGVTVANAPGTIDSDYRGEIKIILINLGSDAFIIERGMRVAQIVFAKVHLADWKEVAELPESTRAEGGFGSTGA